MAYLNFNLEDASQVIAGAFALGVPISFSEEAWKMGDTLPLANLTALLFLSLIFLAFYTYQGVFQSNIENRLCSYFARILFAYVLTFLVVALILTTLNKLPLISDPATAIRRLIVISMPASMGAIIVDGFDKE